MMKDIKKEFDKKFGEEFKDTPIVWDSGLKILSPKIYLDSEVFDIASSIQKYVGDNEFSILLKGMWDDKGFYVTSEYMIPDQYVNYSNVDFEGDISKYRYKGYNTILHSHPFSSTNFSFHDERSINVHFDCSLLFSVDKIVAGTICLKLDNERKLKIPVSDINFVTKDCNVLGIDNIKIMQMIEYPKNYGMCAKYIND